MPRPQTDYSEQRFNKWVVLSQYRKDKHGNVRWQARCDCGTVKWMNPVEAKRGKTKSCGCNLMQSNMTTQRRKELAKKARDKRLKYANYDGALGKVVEVLPTPDGAKKNAPIYKVKCAECNGYHIYGTTSLRNDSLTRLCPKYKTYNYSGLTKKQLYIRSHYGMSPEQHDALRKLQDDKCAICNGVLAQERIDHCHESGEVRGLLCQGCNSGLGLLGDNISGIKRALAYLQNTPFSQVKEK